MNKNLMYGESTEGNGWSKCDPLIGQRIETDIIDAVNQSTKGAKIPRVSIPSPFARFELVQRAFEDVNRMGDRADTRDKQLVSHALDAFQLFFEMPEKLEIIEWNKNNEIEDLLASGYKSHNLVGETLVLYMRQENFGFNEREHYTSNPSGIPNNMSLFFLAYEKQPVAVTSPTSVFLASPNYKKFQSELTIDSGQPIFSKERINLVDRDEEFVLYIYKTFRYWKYLLKGREQVERPLAAFKNYLEDQKKYIQSRNRDLYNKIVNLQTSDALDDLMYDYQECPPVNIMGLPLYTRRKEQLQEQINSVSDFVLKSPKSERSPLVLTNNHTVNGWRYTSQSVLWDLRKHAIDYTNRRERRLLPGTETEYSDGWICEHDFLADVLVQLPYSIKKTDFFDGNLKDAPQNVSFLMPIKPQFFEFFTIEHLMGMDGREPNFKMEVKKNNNDSVKEVVVSLRVPLSEGRTVVLKKTYTYPEDASSTYGLDAYPNIKQAAQEARGYIVKTPVEVSVFPFVKLLNNNHYVIQLMRHGWDSYQGQLTAYRTATYGPDQEVEYTSDEVTRPSKTKYYSLDEDFDYLMLSINKNEFRKDTALLIPLMKTYEVGNRSLHFAFDFGTSNSHIAVRDAESNEFLDFNLTKSVGSTLDTKIPETNKDIATKLFVLRNKQEFLPKEGLGEAYKFPMSTVLLKPNDMVTDSPKGLQHMNIPFVYGKEDYNEAQNKIASNLKWSDEDSSAGYAIAYIEELILLARAFAIEHHADLSKCDISWTYPLSMDRGSIQDFENKWVELYSKYFNPNSEAASDHVVNITESIAPLLYYLDIDKANEEFNLSIDIGGGTCDVVLYVDKENQRITSFRFGAENIFGVGTNKSVPMIANAFEYFIKKFTDITRSENSEIVSELKKFNSKEVNANEATGRLFGLESHRLLKKLALADKSYNSWLSTKREYKMIFVYYYAAIIYYLTKLLIANGFTQKPQAIFFSGTGSKLLNIIGGNGKLCELTSIFIEKFSNGKFTYPNSLISINIESKEPKQLTAKGALYKGEMAKNVASRTRSKMQIDRMMMRHPMSDIVTNRSKVEDTPNQLLYKDLENPQILAEIVEEADNFNKMFYEILNEDNGIVRLSDEMLDEFRKHYVDNPESKNMLMTYIKTIIGRRIPKSQLEKNANKPYPDVPFFYPVKEIISRILKCEK